MNDLLTYLPSLSIFFNDQIYLSLNTSLIRQIFTGLDTFSSHGIGSGVGCVCRFHLFIARRVYGGANRGRISNHSLDTHVL